MEINNSEPTDFRSSFAHCRKYAIKTLNYEMKAMFMCSHKSSQIQFFHGLVFAFYSSEMITSSEYKFFNQFLEYYSVSYCEYEPVYSHSAHIVSFFNSRC